MAQAELIPTTSRRSFLVSAAVAAVLAPALAGAEILPVASITDWKRFETELMTLRSLIEEAEDDISFSNRGIAAWEKRNPFPDDRWSTPAQLAAVQLRERAWVERYANAVRQSGRGSLNKARSALRARYDDLLQRIADTPAVNRADSQAKARLVRFESTTGPIRKSLFRNLLTL